jgi:hypothetical protein
MYIRTPIGTSASVCAAIPRRLSVKHSARGKSPRPQSPAESSHGLSRGSCPCVARATATGKAEVSTVSTGQLPEHERTTEAGSISRHLFRRRGSPCLSDFPRRPTWRPSREIRGAPDAARHERRRKR